MELNLKILLARTNCASIVFNTRYYIKLISLKSKNEQQKQVFENMLNDIIQVEQTIKDLEIDNKTRIAHINNCEIAILQRDKVIREQEEKIKELEKKNKELLEFI